jgi:adenylyltransferase/sulfurtransferase
LLISDADEDPKLNLLSLSPSATPYRSVKTRGPSIKCIACGPNATITDDLEAVPYDAFCGVTEPVEEERRGGEKVERVRVEELKRALDGEKAVVIDTRQEVEYGICALPDSTSRFPSYR